MKNVVAYVGAGANMGDSHQTLVYARRVLVDSIGISSLRSSPFYRSAPIDSSGDDYVNAVFEVETSLSAHLLLDLLQSIEQQFGRERPYQNAPRTLDLDLLLFADQSVHDARLSIPHPRMHQRAFVLIPLLDLNPTLSIPGQGLAQTFLPEVVSQHIYPLDDPDTL